MRRRRGGKGEALVLAAIEKLDTFNRRVGGDVQEERVPEGGHLSADDLEVLAARERERERVEEPCAVG